MSASASASSGPNVPSTLTWSAVMGATTLGTLGISYADPAVAAVRRPLMLGGGAGFVGYALAANFAWSGARDYATAAGLGASALTAIATLPAYRATKSAFLLNGLLMSFTSAGFYGYKRTRLHED